MFHFYIVYSRGLSDRTLDSFGMHNSELSSHVSSRGFAIAPGPFAVLSDEGVFNRIFLLECALTKKVHCEGVKG